MNLSQYKPKADNSVDLTRENVQLVNSHLQRYPKNDSFLADYNEEEKIPKPNDVGMAMTRTYNKNFDLNKDGRINQQDIDIARKAHTKPVTATEKEDQQRRREKVIERLKEREAATAAAKEKVTNSQIVTAGLEGKAPLIIGGTLAITAAYFTAKHYGYL